MIAGFILGVTGIGLLSVPWACIVAGVVLFVSGGFATRK